MVECIVTTMGQWFEEVMGTTKRSYYFSSRASITIRHALPPLASTISLTHIRVLIYLLPI